MVVPDTVGCTVGRFVSFHSSLPPSQLPAALRARRRFSIVSHLSTAPHLWAVGAPPPPQFAGLRRRGHGGTVLVCPHRRRIAPYGCSLKQRVDDEPDKHAVSVLPRMRMGLNHADANQKLRSCALVQIEQIFQYCYHLTVLLLRQDCLISPGP